MSAAPSDPAPDTASRLRPGAWAGRILARAFQRPLPRALLLNGLRPSDRLDLALEAVQWGALDHHDRAGWAVLERFVQGLRQGLPEATRYLPGELPEATAFALALAAAVNPRARARIHDGVRALAERDDRELAYGLRVFRGCHEWITRHAGGPAGKRILELGPGHTLVPGLLLVASGAERWVGADLYPLASLDPDLYRRLRQELAEDRGLVRGPGYDQECRAMLERLDSALRVEDERVVLDQERVAWRHPVDGADLPFPDGSFELCLSNATLEHVRDPAAAARESLRVLAPGGIGLHQIDLRDHRDFSRPLEFLRLSREAWDASFAPASASAAVGEQRDAFTYTNRWRKDDFVRAFERAGGRVLACHALERVPVSDALRAQLDPAFRERAQEDLETVSLDLIVQRPARG